MSPDDDFANTVFPVPPDDGFWGRIERLHQKAGGLIRTAEFALVLACIGIASTSGGDMSLAVPFLLLGWAIGVVGIGGSPSVSSLRKKFFIGLLTFTLAAIWLFLVIHFERRPQREDTADSPRATASDRPLQNLSNKQLKDAAIEVAKQMREFEANTDILELPSYSSNDTEEQKNEKWRAQVARDSARHSRKKLAFTNNYLGQARELRDEIVVRLQKVGILSPYVQMNELEIGPEVLDGRHLAGAYPVAAAANYLEKLARRLPAP